MFPFLCREFPVRLENPHVITRDQLWAGVVPVGPSGYSFNSSYHSRDSVEYKQELGNAIGMYFIPQIQYVEKLGVWKRRSAFQELYYNMQQVFI